jgi:hypothetical protein
MEKSASFGRTIKAELAIFYDIFSSVVKDSGNTRKTALHFTNTIFCCQKLNMTSSPRNSKPSAVNRQGFAAMSSSRGGTTGSATDSSLHRSSFVDQPSLLSLISRAPCDPTDGVIDIFQADFSGRRSQRLELSNILDEVLSITSPGNIRAIRRAQDVTDKQ